MSNYKKLAREHKKQLGEFMIFLEKNGHITPMDDLEHDWVEEEASKLVVNCLHTAQQKALAFIKRYRDLADFDQQGKDEIDQEVDAWLREGGVGL